MTPIILICGQAGSGKDTVAGFISELEGAVAIAQADPMKRFASSVFKFTDEQLWGPSELRNLVDARGTDEAYWVDALLRFYRWSRPWVTEVLPDASREEVDYAVKYLGDWFRDTIMKACKDEGKPFTPRYVLQTLGTEWGRRVSSDMWVKHAIRTANLLLIGPYTYAPNVGLTLDSKAKQPYWVVITDGRFRNEILAVQAIGGKAVRVISSDKGDGGAAALAAGVANHQSEVEQRSIPDHFFSRILVNSKERGLVHLRDTVARLMETLRDEVITVL